MSNYDVIVQTEVSLQNFRPVSKDQKKIRFHVVCAVLTVIHLGYFCGQSGP